MEHIYIHIPFCLQKCGYCDFYSVNSLDLLESYVQALVGEIGSYKDEYFGQNITTIFLGGGTPSVLSSDQLQRIVAKLKEVFVFDHKLEFSLEVNPETYKREKFLEFKKIGVTRISVGVQSFDDQELKALGRIHDSQTAKQALNEISLIFENVNIDLMYGLPGQSLDKMKQNLRTAIDLKPKHISFYELTPVISDRTENYLFGKKLLEENGYKQYEISNYALKGYECRHNLAYWSDKSYLGIGAGAHGYLKERGIRRFNNTLDEYLKGNYQKGAEPSYDSERLIMGLRKNEGIPKYFIPQDKLSVIRRFLDSEHLAENEKNYFFTEKGRLLSNTILVELI